MASYYRTGTCICIPAIPLRGITVLLCCTVVNMLCVSTLIFLLMVQPFIKEVGDMQYTGPAVQQPGRLYNF